MYYFLKKEIFVDKEKRSLRLHAYVQDAILAMAGDNENAALVCTEMMEVALFVDSTSPIRSSEPLDPLYCLDDLDIRNEDICRLYKDVCIENIANMLALLRGVRLGLASKETLKHAIAYKGEGLNLGAIICKVQESP